MNIQIRPWLPQDVDMLMGWILYKRSILKMMKMPEDADEFDIRHAIVTAPAQRFVAFRDNVPVAAFALYDIKENGTAFGAIIANPFQPSGFATLAAAKQMIGAMFNGAGLQELHFIISDDNEPAIKLAKHLETQDLGVRQFRLTKSMWEGRGNGPGNGTSNR